MLFKNKKKYQDSGRVEAFTILTIRESGMRSVVEYEAKNIPGGAQVSVYTIRYSISDGKEYREVNEQSICDRQKVLDLFNECDLLSFDGFYGRHPRGVLDGIMFRLTANVNGGRKISAEGSANFPKGYKELTEALFKLAEGRKEQAQKVELTAEDLLAAGLSAEDLSQIKPVPEAMSEEGPSEEGLSAEEPAGKETNADEIIGTLGAGV